MRDRPRLIGFTAAHPPADFSSRRLLATASPSLRCAFTPRIQLSSQPLPFRVPSPPCPALHPPKEAQSQTCLDFVPSSRHHVRSSTFLRGFPCPRIRSVLRLSRPLDVFLRSHARGLISSRCHVQGSPVQGVLLSRSHPSSSERACPLAVVLDALTAEAVSRRRAPGFEAFICARVRCLRAAVIHHGPRPLPSSGFSPPGPPLPWCSRFTQPLRS